MSVDLSTYNQAQEVLQSRFAHLALLISLDKRKKEFAFQKLKIQAEKEDVIYIYGIEGALLYFSCQKWLHAKKTRRLIFLEDDLGLIHGLLDKKEALAILSDPQVHIELFSDQEEQIASLAKRFAERRVEIYLLPSKKQKEELRLKLLKKTALFSALRLDRLHGYQPFANWLANQSQLSQSFYANHFKGAFKNVPAIICGAGPSLTENIELLQKMGDQALLIAGGSTIAALSSFEISPHFGMAIDPNLEEYRRFKNSFAFECPLLYSTRLHRDVFSTCSGPFGYMRSAIGGMLELWMDEELGLEDSLIGESFPEGAVSVTAVCIAWAHFLGCNPIYLNGVDMAYKGQEHYAKGVMESSIVDFEEIDREKSAPDRILLGKNPKGEEVTTAVRWVMEAESIAAFAKEHPQISLVNTSLDGLVIEGISHTPLEKIPFSTKKRDFRKEIQELIDRSPMCEKTEEIVRRKCLELIESLSRVIDCLKILSGKIKGSAALAEMDLEEEVAYLYLFYDIREIFPIKENFWQNFLDLALKYQKVALNESFTQSDG